MARRTQAQDDGGPGRLVFSDLMSADTTRRIVRWEVLSGLPGDGPIPFHFHLGHPTPWAEGFVVRFSNHDGTKWVGNFQGGYLGHSDVVLWPGANAVAVIAGGYCYFIDAGNPASYSTLGSQCQVSDTSFDEQRQMFFVTDSYWIYAYDVRRRPIWKNGPGEDITKIVSCRGGVLTVEVEEETGGAKKTLRLSTQDGTTL